MEQQTDIFKTAMKDPEFRAYMEQLKVSGANREKYARRQYFMSQITAAASLVLLGIVLYATATLLPKANTSFQNLDTVIQNLDTVTAELAEADLNEMIGNINGLVTSSEQNIQEALTQVNSIDIDTLNQAIKNLSDAVAPLADFFNRF